MRKFGSDIVVELMAAHGIEYLAMNPGASYRGLHDSLVNGPVKAPEMIICTNEKIAVAVAHGYARVTGRPMGAIVHNVVGLMQATMGIFTAYLDQAPVLVFGGTGPMAVGKRRPHIEWAHTAFAQGELVRNFVKWDDQPFDHEGVVDGFARGYQIATMEPCGPVYLCYDVALQEEPLDVEPPMVVHANHPQPQFAADDEALAEIAQWMVAAERPVVVAGRAGRTEQTSLALARLASLLSVPVYDQQWRFNLPNTQAEHFLEQHVVEGADFVLALDVTDLYGALTVAEGGDRSRRRWLPGQDAKVVEIRLDLVQGNGWSPKFERYQRVDRSVMANTASAVPRLLAMVEEQLGSRSLAATVQIRKERIAKLHDADHDRYRKRSERGWNDTPISTARLASELFAAVKEHDWVLSGSSLGGWTNRLWELDRWDRFGGRSLGTATQIGIGMGVGLAHRGRDKLVVHIEPDGDLLFDPGVLWTIAQQRLPMLIVMFNNRAYYNDWEHQEIVAKDRGRDVSRAHIGMDLSAPSPDFASIAKGFGLHAVGPVEHPDDLGKALAAAARTVTEEKIPVLVDVLTQYR